MDGIVVFCCVAAGAVEYQLGAAGVLIEELCDALVRELGDGSGRCTCDVPYLAMDDDPARVLGVVLCYFRAAHHHRDSLGELTCGTGNVG